MNLNKLINKAFSKKLIKESTATISAPIEIDINGDYFNGKRGGLKDHIAKNYKALDKWIKDKNIESISIDDDIEVFIDTDQIVYRPIGDYYPTDTIEFVADIESKDFGITYFKSDDEEEYETSFKELSKEDDGLADEDELLQCLMDIINDKKLYIED